MTYGISALNASGHEIFDPELSPYTKVDSITSSGGIVRVSTVAFEFNETTYIRTGVPSELYDRALTTFYKPLPRGSGYVLLRYQDPFIFVAGGLNTFSVLDPQDDYLDIEYVFTVPSLVVGDPNTGYGINIYNSNEEVIFTSNIESYVTIELASVVEVNGISDLPVTIPAPRDLIGKVFYFPEIAIEMSFPDEQNPVITRANLRIDYETNEIKVYWNRNIPTGAYFYGSTPLPVYIPVFIGSVAD